MTNTNKKLAMAKDLVAKMAEAGHVVSLRDAWKLSALVGVAAGRVRDEQARKDRAERVRRGMVGNWCADMRAAGLWDGE